MVVLVLAALSIVPIAAEQFCDVHAEPDPLRVNQPKVPFALEPLRWGTVSPRGWLLEWATALSHGSGSPKCSAFATTKPNGHSVDGWRGGRPNFGGFWDEDSASVSYTHLTLPTICSV